jgi:capsular polysaccharide biosynthesis protein
MTGPYLAGLRLIRNTRRNDYLAGICSFDDATEAKIVDVVPETTGFCYPPRSFECAHQIQPRAVTFPAIRTIILKDQFVEVRSSYPYDEKRNCIYVDEAFSRSASYATYAGGHLVAHGRRKAIVRRNAAPITIEQGIFLGGNGSFNYYHWLLEIASKLQVLPRLPEAMREVPLLVNRRVSEIGSYGDVLKVLAPERKLVYLDEGRSYFIQRATFIQPFVTVPFNLRGDHKFSAEHCSTRPDAVHYLRNAVLPALGGTDAAHWPERIYLARGNRRPYNQDELVAIAAKRGFEVLYPDQHSFLKQAGFFANARVLVGPMGAAYSNLVFANPHCKALNWMPEELGEYALFSNISGILGIGLRHLFYSSGIRSTGDCYGHSYQIRPDLFQRALDCVLDQ